MVQFVPILRFGTQQNMSICKENFEKYKRTEFFYIVI